MPTAEALARDLTARRDEVLASFAPRELEALVDLLWNDASTEYDARHLTEHLRRVDGGGEPFGAAFWRAHDLWAVEEEHHFEGLLVALEVLVGECARGAALEVVPGEQPPPAGVTWRGLLARRSYDPAPLADVLVDEVGVLVCGAYDELVTVRAYRANLHVYDRLGELFGRFVRAVIADEAAHYARYLEVLVQEHPAALDQVPARLELVRATGAVAPYGNMFLLDHHGPEYTEELCDAAARALLAQVG